MVRKHFFNINKLHVRITAKHMHNGRSRDHQKRIRCRQPLAYFDTNRTHTYMQRKNCIFIEKRPDKLCIVNNNAYCIQVPTYIDL